MGENAALGTKVVRGRADTSLISFQVNAMAGAKLRQAGTFSAREGAFSSTNLRRPGSQNPVMLIRTDRLTNDGSVDVLLRFLVEEIWDGAAAKMMLNRRSEAAGQSLLHTARTRRTRDDGFGRMMKTGGAGEELGAKHIRVVNYRDDARFLVDMIRRRHTMTACDSPKGSVLHRLQFPLDDGGPHHRPPDASGIIVRRPHVRLEGLEKEFLVVAPIRAG